MPLEMLEHAVRIVERRILPDVSLGVALKLPVGFVYALFSIAQNGRPRTHRPDRPGSCIGMALRYGLVDKVLVEGLTDQAADKRQLEPTRRGTN